MYIYISAAKLRALDGYANHSQSKVIQLPWFSDSPGLKTFKDDYEIYIERACRKIRHEIGDIDLIIKSLTSEDPCPYSYFRYKGEATRLFDDEHAWFAIGPQIQNKAVILLAGSSTHLLDKNAASAVKGTLSPSIDPVGAVSNIYSNRQNKKLKDATNTSTSLSYAWQEVWRRGGGDNALKLPIFEGVATFGGIFIPDYRQLRRVSVFGRMKNIKDDLQYIILGSPLYVRQANTVGDVNMKATKDNIDKAILLLTLMAEEAEGDCDTLIDPHLISKKHNLAFSSSEIIQFEKWLVAREFLDEDNATLGGICITQKGFDETDLRRASLEQNTKNTVNKEIGSEVSTDNVDSSEKTKRYDLNISQSKSIQVFISYCQKDKEPFLSELLEHIKPYVRKSGIVVWSDEDITPGSNWFGEIQAALASAKVAVLLVSPSFLASDFVHEHELGPLLKDAERGGVRILWVPVRACSYELTQLRNYQAVLPPSKPLAEMTVERDKAWVTVCKEIQRALQQVTG